MKLLLAGQHVLGNTPTEFYEISTSSLVDETILQTWGHVSRSDPDFVRTPPPPDKEIAFSLYYKNKDIRYLGSLQFILKTKWKESPLGMN
jgi:hypothetical protein